MKNHVKNMQQDKCTLDIAAIGLNLALVSMCVSNELQYQISEKDKLKDERYSNAML